MEKDIIKILNDINKSKINLNFQEIINYVLNILDDIYIDENIYDKYETILEIIEKYYFKLNSNSDSGSDSELEFENDDIKDNDLYLTFTSAPLFNNDSTSSLLLLPIAFIKSKLIYIILDFYLDNL